MSRTPESLLWPRPQRLERQRGAWRLPAEVRVAGAGFGPVANTAAAELARELQALGVRSRRVEGSPAEVRLAVEPAAGLNAEGYRLEVGGRGASVTAADEAGVLYGAATLGQWLRLAVEPAGAGGQGLFVPGLRAEDWPDFAHRGVLLDVSRDRVPTMATLRDLVDRLSSWKVNQLQLYTEHTFAYAGHESVWKGASPLTADEVRELDAFCREHAVELVPCQQSFGHLHRWLRHEPYRQLAECPEGIEHPWSTGREPYGLCPTDRKSLALLADLYGQLLPSFSSARFNVGLDEPIDLGLCRSARAAERRGKEHLYLDFLQGVARQAARHGRTIQVWGDFLAEHPDLLAELPAGATVLEWGYEADHPFAERCRRLAEAKVDFYVCPGTSSWNSLAGRAANALANLRAAAQAGHEAGACGYLVCDWGDNGHLQPSPVSELGFLVGAGCGWNVAAAREETDAAGLLDAHAFRDEAGAMGGAMLALGNAYETTGGRNRNGSALFFLLLDAGQPVARSRAAGIFPDGLSEVRQRVRTAMAGLARARMARPDRRLVADELTWVGEAMEVACRLGLARLGRGAQTELLELPRTARHDLSLRVLRLAVRHRSLWLRRSRPGGLDDSAARLDRLRAQLAGEQ